MPVPMMMVMEEGDAPPTKGCVQMTQKDGSVCVHAVDRPGEESTTVAGQHGTDQRKKTAESRTLSRETKTKKEEAGKDIVIVPESKSSPVINIIVKNRRRSSPAIGHRANAPSRKSHDAASS